jgi:CPA2 family monovalent cation:H+ antiporter-2
LPVCAKKFILFKYCEQLARLWIPYTWGAGTALHSYAHEKLAGAGKIVDSIFSPLVISLRMNHADHLSQIVLLLTASVCMVAFFRRFNLSPILAYIACGALVGPFGYAFINDVATTNAVAEFGVVFLLFVIGLELSFERLKRLRGKVMGFGVAQVILTGGIIALAAILCGQNIEAAIIIGGALALSSTAIVLELLENSPEKYMKTGRLCLATLVVQDLAVIPLLVLIPLLAADGSILQAMGEATLKAVIGLMIILMIGRLLLRPMFSMIAANNNHELFIATTLLVVLGLAYISSLAGISPALGAFMGGLLVAETEFRHQVEADIMPFKGLLLGLFFITVGMTIDVNYILGNWQNVLLVMVSLIAVKALIMLLLCMAFAFPYTASLHAPLLLAQGGEFAFVMFSLSHEQNIIPQDTLQLLVSGIVLSMVLTPLLHKCGRMLSKRAELNHPFPRSMQVRETLDMQDHVIICGFGRMGRLVAQLLDAEHIPYVALDMDATAVGDARVQGKLVYYGDAARAIVLKGIGISRARAMLITHSDIRSSIQTITTVRGLNRLVPIIARAKNLEQVQELEASGANLAVAEMFEASLQLGGALLKEVGIAETEINRVLEAFRAEDYALTRKAEANAPAVV